MCVNFTRSHGLYVRCGVGRQRHRPQSLSRGLQILAPVWRVTVVCCCVGLRAPIVWTAVSILSGLCQVPHSLGLHDTAASV